MIPTTIIYEIVVCHFVVNKIILVVERKALVMFPSIKQWKDWSLPSKAGYASFILAIVSLLLTGASLYLDIEIYEEVKPSKIVQVGARSFERSYYEQDYYDFLVNGGLYNPSTEADFHFNYYERKCRENYNHSVQNLITVKDIVATNTSSAYMLDREDLSISYGGAKELLISFVLDHDAIFNKFTPAMNVFIYYWQQITSTVGWEDRLVKSYAALRNTRNIKEIVSGLKIRSHPNNCFSLPHGHSVDFPNLEDWVISFWIRRYNEGYAESIYRIMVQQTGRAK